jgi:hypothetical protein
MTRRISGVAGGGSNAGPSGNRPLSLDQQSMRVRKTQRSVNDQTPRFAATSAGVSDDILTKAEWQIQRQASQET